MMKMATFVAVLAGRMIEIDQRFARGESSSKARDQEVERALEDTLRRTAPDQASREEVIRELHGFLHAALQAAGAPVHSREI